jgi:hypothetical protein
MGTSFTPQLKKLLLSHGCRFERQGKGDHEIWFSPILQRHCERCLEAGRDREAPLIN